MRCQSDEAVCFEVSRLELHEPDISLDGVEDGCRIVVPGITVLDRLAGQACIEAEEALFADVGGRLTPDLIIRMEALLGMGSRNR